MSVEKSLAVYLPIFKLKFRNLFWNIWR